MLPVDEGVAEILDEDEIEIVIELVVDDDVEGDNEVEEHWEPETVAFGVRVTDFVTYEEKE